MANYAKYYFDLSFLRLFFLALYHFFPLGEEISAPFLTKISLMAKIRSLGLTYSQNKILSLLPRVKTKRGRPKAPPFVSL